jgi:superoxide oxidase
VQEDYNSFAAPLDTHRNSGVTWIVGAARLVWRHNYAYLPPFPESMPRLQQAIAKANECSLNALLLVQPITRLGRVLLRGAPFELIHLESTVAVCAKRRKPFLSCGAM